MSDPSPRHHARLKSAGVVLVMVLFSLQALCAQPAQSPATDAAKINSIALPDSLARIRELRSSDPAAAVAYGAPLFSAASGSERTSIGIELAESYVAAKRIAEAQGVVDALVASAQALTSATLLRLRLMIAAASRDWAAVDALADTVVATAASTSDGMQRAQLMAQFGTALLLQNKFPEAEAAYGEALEAVGVAADNDGTLHFDLLQKLGVSQAQQGRYPDAIESFNRAEAVGKDIGRSEDPTFLLRFGGVFLYIGDSPHAIAYLTRALAAADANPLGTVNRMSIYNNLGTAYYGEKNFEQAARWFETSIEYSRKNGENPGHALNNLGAVLREAGRNREALARFEEALALARANKEKEGIAVSSKNIGETLILLGQRKKAVAPLELAYDIYAETDQRPKRLELYPVIIENLEALGRTGDALKLMREYKTLNDEVVNVESRERVSTLETAIDLAEKEKQLVASERNRLGQADAIETLERQQGFDRTVNRGMLLAIAALALLIVLQIRDRMLKARAHRELAAKSAQIEEQSRALVALNAVVLRQSQEDVLTGLKNRRFLAEWMAASNQRRAADDVSKRGLEPALLILIDIDHFKTVNDRYGHAMGDQALIQFAGILRDCKRDSDLIVRWGGEEFVWLCPDTSISSAPMLCERVRTALHAQPLLVNDESILLTASIGFAAHPLWPGQPSDWQLSMRVADHALYQCKADGRDRWMGYAPGVAPTLESIRNGDIVSLEANDNLVKIAAIPR